MISHHPPHLMQAIQNAAIPLALKRNQYHHLLNQIGDARFVLIGEATHGTEEFYQSRIEITQALITEKGFQAVAIEGDWPSAYRVHQYIQGKADNDPLADFKRFPNWMWRNYAVSEFINWLKTYNAALALKERIGFYGLDLYSLYDSMQAVIDYLLTVDPEGAHAAKKRYACFDHCQLEPQEYGYLTSTGIKESCLKQVTEQLNEMQLRRQDYIKDEQLEEQEAYFIAQQNARVVKNAENYYRSMFTNHITSWNVRDTHMAETVQILAGYLATRHQQPAKIVIWAHNSHVGDARATEVGERGEINIGQLIREQFPETYLIGYSTYEGTVTAASEWGERAECKKVNPGISESYEELFHEVKTPNFMLDVGRDKALQHYFTLSRLERAIGVVYLPTTERISHYYFTQLAKQFDTIIHFDKTTALRPLDA